MFFTGGSFGSFGDLHGRSQPRGEVNNKKLYESLELEKNCNTADVKKAYRKLAIKHHPDKGGDPEKFKELSHAYEVLSDPEKRKIYDEHGEEGLSESGPGSDPTDIFDLFFGGGRSRGPKGKRKGDDFVSTIKVPLEQIYNGYTRKMAINKDVICSKCDGQGGPASAFERCDPCKGQGIRVQIRQMGPMIQQTQSQCKDCNGEGKIIPPNKKCRNCSGQGVVKEKKVLEVFIQRGVPDRHKIVFAGDADQKPNEIPGDVVFVVDQTPHEEFKRVGADLYATKTLSLYEALTGFQFVLTHLDGRRLLIKNQPGEITRPASMKAVNQEGMPNFKNPFLKGQLYIHFEVEFPNPEDLDEQARKRLGSILPVPDKPLIDEDDPELEVHFVEHVDKEELKKRSERKEAYEDDEDEEGGQGGNQRVQCRQQ